MKRGANLGDLVGIVALHALLQRPSISVSDAVKCALRVEEDWRKEHENIANENMS